MVNRSEWHDVTECASHFMRAVKALVAFVMAHAFACQCFALWWHEVAQMGTCHAKNLKTLAQHDFDGGMTWHGVTVEEHGEVF